MDLNFDKGNGLLPVIIQDDASLQVLMLGYMNHEAYSKTLKEGKVCFYSRTKRRLWTKGERSGNFLFVREICKDCDADALLIKVSPAGSTCHTGNDSCFGMNTGKGFLYRLEQLIHSRIEEGGMHSYTNKLYKAGINKIAQKVGEEAVELVIESKDNNEILFRNEAADLLFHFLILLKAKDLTLEKIEETLMKRSN